ncbi:alpha/beta hydrolase [Actinomycetospora termitidis]|uniref:Alpha/beta hydrolase n=1 Tax=Actinomycetospora termitidis TaxID=3053470 RepID=A0ABT7M413_9PSEU|nr:alpha/beta hydrolase [Actinomycetospora sp. Odt1-22]MDL5154752.1 alpha/beta hydrolase [Actinomycetospora sp. Odt1-22]
MEIEITVESDGQRLGTTYLRAQDESLAGPGGRPCVVMAHGFGATRDSGLLPFAEAFVTAGADVLLVDYRGFGDSEGEPRGHVDHRAHRRDYHAAVARARLIDGVDPERIVLWGSSYSGGHVVAVAAADRRIAGVISQGAAMDGLGALVEILRSAGPRQLLKVSAHAVADAFGHALGRPDHRVAVYGPPGTVAAITAPDAEAGYGAIIGPTFVNEMPARDILTIPLNRPVTAAPRVHCPMLLVVAASDSIAPPAAVRKVAVTAGGPVETLEIDCGHFDIYLGEPFATSIERQIAFVRSV